MPTRRFRNWGWGGKVGGYKKLADMSLECTPALWFALNLLSAFACMFVWAGI